MGILFASTRTADAQQLRGVVRDSATRTALPGAVVSLVDSAGGALARTIADATGGFSFGGTLRGAKVRVVRIGYRPRDISLGDREGMLQVAMVRLPPMLPPVRVSDDEVCPGKMDGGSAFQLWEQARAALLATVVAREAKPADATTLLYDRDLLPGDDLVRRQRVVTRGGKTTRPFIASADASFFAKRGYMREDSTGRTYFAPDADILLDESFAATHCFHVERANPAHADQLGVAFTPVRGRASLVDVSGVIWLDRATPALRSLDFQYTGIEAVAATVGTGGHLEFRTMPNGVSFIERWVLRVPVLAARRSTSLTPSELRSMTTRQDRDELRVTAIHENGGEVMQALWSDATSWRGQPTEIFGTVRQRDGRGPIPNALVTIEGATDTVSADARGDFRFSAVVPGKYMLIAADTLLRAFAPERRERRAITVARGQLAEAHFVLPPISQVIADICRGQKMRDSTTMLIGRVIRRDGAASRGGRIHASWQATYNGGSPVVLDVDERGQKRPVQINVAEQTVDLDDEGRFVVCGVARERPIRLRMTQRDATADTVVMVYDSLLKTVEWRPRMQPPDEARRSGDGASKRTGVSLPRIDPPDDAPLFGAAAAAGLRFANISGVETASRRNPHMTERHKTHNGRDVDGRFRVRQADVDDLLEDPDGVDLVRDDVRLGGAVADTGPQAGLHAREISHLIEENREDVSKATGRNSGNRGKRGRGR